MAPTSGHNLCKSSKAPREKFSRCTASHTEELGAVVKL